jgi:8-oxo-dGTP pyrophosphatase MutT (NUDIX family)
MCVLEPNLPHTANAKVGMTHLTPGTASSTPYMHSSLRRADVLQYRAAGLLAFRVTDDEEAAHAHDNVQVLLARHMRKRTPGSTDVRQRASTWNLLGGKRKEGEEDPFITAAREAEEESGLLLSQEATHQRLLAKDVMALWIPKAAYVVYVVQICDSPATCRSKLCRLRPRELIGAEVRFGEGDEGRVRGGVG